MGVQNGQAVYGGTRCLAVPALKRKTWRGMVLNILVVKAVRDGVS
jgi:hypothetical protein